MKKEDAIKYLQQIYPNGGHCWLDEQRIEAIGMAIKALQEEPVSVWHDVSEEPKENTEIVFQWHSEDSGYKWMDVGFYNKDGNYIKTIGEQGENEIEMKFVTRWAKSEDLLKL